MSLTVHGFVVVCILMVVGLITVCCVFEESKAEKIMAYFVTGILTLAALTVIITFILRLVGIL